MLRGEGWDQDPLLPRPFSIARVRRSDDGLRLEFLLKVVGRGTQLLAAMHPGDVVLSLGPLGRPFEPPPGPAWLVAGGIGIAPFPAVAEAFTDHPLELFLGARNAAEAPGTDDFAALLAAPVHLATDDGSAGHHGTVVDLLKAEFAAGRRPAQVLACGPDPMLHATARVCADAGVACIVSMEAPMACGVGTCRGCVLRAADGSNFTVCVDGPVVEASTLWS
jgi:dihydroorotate dehydrogenase electron transfer subunit